MLFYISYADYFEFINRMLHILLLLQCLANKVWLPLKPVIELLAFKCYIAFLNTFDKTLQNECPLSWTWSTTRRAAARARRPWQPSSPWPRINMAPPTPDSPKQRRRLVPTSCRYPPLQGKRDVCEIINLKCMV